MNVQIVDPDGSPTEIGDRGEILLRGPQLLLGYWGDDEATAAALDADGWLHTGDIGVLADDRHLEVVDRLKALVIVSGFNVSPAEVEDVLVTHPSVAEAVVVGEPDARTGERLVAHVVPEEGQTVDPGALADHCRDRLARYKVPRDVVVTDHLPRTISGKLVRRPA